jgi:hypothetical protein
VRTVGVRLAILSLLVLLAALVLGWAPLLPAALVVLGGLYATQLRVDDAALDGSAAVFAAGLIVTAELGYWSLEERERIETDRGEPLRRLAFVALLGVGSLLVAEAVLALAALVHARGLAVGFAGAAAATAVLVPIVLIARPSSSEP